MSYPLSTATVLTYCYRTLLCHICSFDIFLLAQPCSAIFSILWVHFFKTSFHGTWRVFLFFRVPGELCRASRVSGRGSFVTWRVVAISDIVDHCKASSFHLPWEWHASGSGSAAPTPLWGSSDADGADAVVDLEQGIWAWMAAELVRPLGVGGSPHQILMFKLASSRTEI